MIISQAGFGPRFMVRADRVWDGVADTSSPGKCVVISGNQIEALPENQDLPSDLPALDFPGCTVLPGLIDAHVHLAGWMLPAFLAAGVTTVRDLGNDLETVLALREGVVQDPTSGPRVLCVGPLIDGHPVHWPLFGRGHRDTQSIETSVAELAKAGVNAVKLYAHLDEHLLRAGVEAAHRHGLLAVAHLGETTEIAAVNAGIDEIEHFSGCTAAWSDSGAEARQALADLLLAGDTVMCPTLVVWDRMARAHDLSFSRDRELHWIPQSVQESWAKNDYIRRGPQARADLLDGALQMKKALLTLADRGAQIIAGSDTPFPSLIPGFSLHDELSLMVEAGLTPVAALRSATSASAIALAVADRVGQLAPGLRADCLVVEGDPTETIKDIGRIRAVIRDGVLLNPAELVETWRLRQKVDAESAIELSLRAWANNEYHRSIQDH